MRKDPTLFRLRFQRWKNGELVYDAGLPKYDDGKEPYEVSDATYVQSLDPMRYNINNEENWYHGSPSYMTQMPELAVTAKAKSKTAKQIVSRDKGLTDNQLAAQELSRTNFANRVRNALNEAAPYVLQALTLPFDLTGAFKLPEFAMNLGRGIKSRFKSLMRPETDVQATVAHSSEYVPPRTRLVELHTRDPFATDANPKPTSTSESVSLRPKVRQEVTQSDLSELSPDELRELSDKYDDYIVVPYQKLYDKHGNVINSANRVRGQKKGINLFYHDFNDKFTPHTALYDQDGFNIDFGYNTYSGIPPRITPRESSASVAYGFDDTGYRNTIRKLDYNPKHSPDEIPAIYDKDGKIMYRYQLSRDFLPNEPLYDINGNRMSFVTRREPLHAGFANIDNGYYPNHWLDVAYDNNFKNLPNYDLILPGDIQSTVLNAYDHLGTHTSKTKSTSEVLQLINETVNNMHHGQAFSESNISTDAYPLELLYFMKNADKGRPFVVDRSMTLNNFGKAYEDGVLLEAGLQPTLDKINKLLNRYRVQFDYSVDELPDATLYDMFGQQRIRAPRIGFRKYKYGKLPE